MEQYKEKLKVNQRIIIFCALLMAAVSVVGILAQGGIISLEPVAGDSHWQSRWRGFLSGGSAGVAGAMIGSLIKIRKALKDEKELKKLYILENDERQLQIATAARSSAMQAFLLLGLVATVAAGYFSIAVSLPILACVLSGCLLAIGFKMYYSRKY